MGSEDASSTISYYQLLLLIRLACLAGCCFCWQEKAIAVAGGVKGGEAARGQVEALRVVAACGEEFADGGDVGAVVFYQ